MRTTWLLLFAALAACSAPRTEEPQVPKALQEPGVMDDLKSYSGRSGNYDLVEALFEEALKSDSTLRQLFEAIEAQHHAHADTTERWQHYEQKNLQYYEDAKQHSERMSDTIARAEQLTLLRKSQERYEVDVRDARGLDSAYRHTRSSIADLQELVKVQRTLEMLERYQKEQRPHDATLRAEVERITALELRLRKQVKQ